MDIIDFGLCGLAILVSRTARNEAVNLRHRIERAVRRNPALRANGATRRLDGVPTVRVEDNRGWFCVVIEASSDADLSRIRTVIQSLNA